MADYNDAKGTTQGSVLTMLDKAIELAEAGEICFLYAKESSRGWATRPMTRK